MAAAFLHGKVNIVPFKLGVQNGSSRWVLQFYDILNSIVTVSKEIQKGKNHTSRKINGTRLKLPENFIKLGRASIILETQWSYGYEYAFQTIK